MPIPKPELPPLIDKIAGDPEDKAAKIFRCLSNESARILSLPWLLKKRRKSSCKTGPRMLDASAKRSNCRTTSIRQNTIQS